MEKINWPGVLFCGVTGASIGYLCGDTIAGMAIAYITMGVFSLLIEPFLP